jgi:transposase-like protein
MVSTPPCASPPNPGRMCCEISRHAPSRSSPRLTVGDGALGFWNALDQVYPWMRHRRCWFHTLGNVLNTLPKSLQGKAKAHLEAI